MLRGARLISHQGPEDRIDPTWQDTRDHVLSMRLSALIILKIHPLKKYYDLVIEILFSISSFLAQIHPLYYTLYRLPRDETHMSVSLFYSLSLSLSLSLRPSPLPRRRGGPLLNPPC